MPDRLVTMSIEDTLVGPPLDDKRRLMTLSNYGWKWLVQTFNTKQQFCMETVHMTDDGKNTEINAIMAIGRGFVAVDLTQYRTK